METVHYPKRGEIYFLEFSHSKGHAMRNPHPALVVQNNVANRCSGTVIVVPLTTNLTVVQLPVGVAVEPPEGGLRKKSAIHCGQLHTVDKGEFTLERLYGHVSPVTMQKVDHALKVSLSLVI